MINDKDFLLTLVLSNGNFRFVTKKEAIYPEFRLQLPAKFMESLFNVKSILGFGVVSLSKTNQCCYVVSGISQCLKVIEFIGNGLEGFERAKEFNNWRRGINFLYNVKDKKKSVNFIKSLLPNKKTNADKKAFYEHKFNELSRITPATGLIRDII